MSFAPLSGLRVLDLSRLLPGALATRRLVELGADVVKVEEPGRGDYLRTIPPLVGGEGLMHQILNRGKRSVALDLRDPQDRAIWEKLATVADVIVEVSRPGRFAQLGVDFASLRRQRPELVICSVTGFGQDGPLSTAPSHGMNMDALAGCVRLEYRNGRVRLAPGQLSLGAELGGANAALAIVAAVIGAKRTGNGAWLDASCWDSVVDANRLWLGHLAATSTPLFDLAEVGPLYDVYATSDHRVVLIAAIESKFCQRFCEGIGRPDLAARWRGVDVSFGTGDDVLAKELAEVFAAEPADVWLRRFEEWDVPGCEVLDHRGVLDSRHLRARALIEDAPPGEVPNFASPLRSIEGGRAGVGLAPAPQLDADRSEVFASWLGSPGPTDEGVRR